MLSRNPVFLSSWVSCTNSIRRFKKIVQFRSSLNWTKDDPKTSKPKIKLKNMERRTLTQHLMDGLRIWYLGLQKFRRLLAMFDWSTLQKNPKNVIWLAMRQQPAGRSSFQNIMENSDIIFMISKVLNDHMIVKRTSFLGSLEWILSCYVHVEIKSGTYYVGSYSRAGTSGGQQISHFVSHDTCHHLGVYQSLYQSR